MSAAAPPTTAAAARPATTWRAVALRTVPYVVGASVVGWLLHKYPLHEIVAEMRLGHAAAMVPAGLVVAFVVWLPYSACDRLIMLGTIGPVPYRDVLRAKAASATLLLLGYFFGGSGYALWIARKMGVGAARAMGVVLYAMSGDLTAVCLVAAASAWLGGAEVPHVLRAIATSIFALQVTLIVVSPFGYPRRLPVILQPWRTVPRAWGLAQIGVRAINIVTMVGLTWVGARAFGLQVPLGVMAIYMPIILLVTSLPINVAGLGAAQAAWLLLLPWASGPRLLAFQVLWHLCTSAGILLRGLPFVRRVASEIAGGRDAAQTGGA